MKALLLFFVLASSDSARAQSHTSEALKGIHSVMVAFDGIAPFDTTALRTTIELDLRKAGMHVVAESSGEKVDAILSVRTVGELDSTFRYTFAFGRIVIERRLYFHPQPSSEGIVANVWETNFFSTGAWDVLKSNSEKAIDTFLNQWLEANPPRPTN